MGFVLFCYTGPCLAKRNSWEIYIWIGSIDDEMATPLACWQAPVDYGVVGARKHWEIWVKKAISWSNAAQKYQGEDSVLDIGALEKIKSGGITVVPAIKRFLRGQVELENGGKLDIDSVVLATGYRSNVPSWLQVRKCSNFSVFLFFLETWEFVYL